MSDKRGNERHVRQGCQTNGKTSAMSDKNVRQTGKRTPCQTRMSDK
ncbi:hypothetical protein ACQCVE_04685 [Metabacillus sp. 113a]